MMRKSVSLWAVAACFLVAASAFGQNADDPPERATTIPTAGFWPTDRMMDRIIDRITDKMGKHYTFDDDQAETTRELFRANYPTFLNENRAEIQTLMNEYFEALLNKEPPSIEEVADWAQRVQPLLAEFGEVTHEVTEGMREYMTDEQTTMLDAETAAFETGLQFAQNKLSAWSAGGYDPETEWIYSKEEYDDEERERARAAGEQGKADEQPEAVAASAPKDEWTIYTEKFIRRYELNVEQKQKAFTFLRRQQESRDRYLQRKTDEMGRVSKVLKEAETEEDRQAALALYEKLNAPVDRMFQTLKDRLDTLPTRAQRKAAAASADEVKTPASATASAPAEEREKSEEPSQDQPTTEPPAEDE